MRTAIMIVLGVELVALALAWWGLAFGKSNSDLAGQGMSAAYAIVGSAIALLLMVPAFAMACYAKLPWVAFALAAVAAVFVLLAVGAVFVS